MTDLHSHILPEMDDGAKDVASSLQMLESESLNGVTQVALTAHFNVERMDADTFCARRAQSWNKLSAALTDTVYVEKLKLKLGAEVFFSPKLSEMDLTPLCLQGTDYMLLELPTNYEPYLFYETLRSISGMGIILILAHIERYPYLMESSDRLYELAASGIYIQTNCNSLLLSGRSRKQILRGIDRGLIHLLSTDAHDPVHRRVNMKEGMDVVSKMLGSDRCRQLSDTADRIFNGLRPEDIALCKPGKLLKWRR